MHTIRNSHAMLFSPLNNGPKKLSWDMLGERKVVPVPKEIQAASLSASPAEAPMPRVAAILARQGPTAIVPLVGAIIEEATMLRASDIHIEPRDTEVTVRLRIDGVLIDSFTLPRPILPEVISRIKVLSQLRTDEHQAAQDGRFRMPLHNGTQVDIRVSITPTYYGENAVLRLLADNAAEYTLESLGFSEDDIKKIQHAVKRPHGMILATGPTGSGKTTTLYTLVKGLNTKEKSIVTIEDPIEYAVPGITQIQINQRSGLTFANGLRSILRQDPNVIMVGEIRDAETATIAVNTALTGHLLLSTLHTNDASTTLPRLLDMGIDAYLIASTVNVAIGQRLVRKICERCKEPYTLSTAERESLRESLPTKLRLPGQELPETFFQGRGCAACDNTGYAGRIGVNEVLVVGPEVRDAILRRAPAITIKDIAVANGMTTMFEDGFNKAADGKTTIAELLRTLSE
jgi:type II secretory ATPase GspE/PulE/Tfp pilus assembly ATPase PilB-like protein